RHKTSEYYAKKFLEPNFCGFGMSRNNDNSAESRGTITAGQQLGGTGYRGGYRIARRTARTHTTANRTEYWTQRASQVPDSHLRPAIMTLPDPPSDLPQLPPPFIALPITYPPTPAFPQPATQVIYLRPHAPSVPTPSSSRSLFITNLPPDADLP